MYDVIDFRGARSTTTRKGEVFVGADAELYGTLSRANLGSFDANDNLYACEIINSRDARERVVRTCFEGKNESEFPFLPPPFRSIHDFVVSHRCGSALHHDKTPAGRTASERALFRFSTECIFLVEFSPSSRIDACTRRSDFEDSSTQDATGAERDNSATANEFIIIYIELVGASEGEGLLLCSRCVGIGEEIG